MKKLKVGLVLDDTLDSPDGVQQYVINLGEWLSLHGHDVHYLVGHTERKDITNTHSLSRNVSVKFNGNRMSVPLPTSKSKIKAFLAENHFDVLHVQVPYSPLLAGRLIHEASEETAIVGTFHILPHSITVRYANRFLAVLNNRTKKRFDEMAAVSEPAGSFALYTYGYKTTVIPNPVKLTQFDSTSSKSNRFNIVFLGRLVERKGAMQLLKAIAYIVEHKLNQHDFNVKIGGKGHLLPSLKNFVQQNNLEHIVTFSGFIAEDQKASFLAQADIAVFPSTGGESFGIVLLEAFASVRGVVLAGDNPGYRSVMNNREDQLLKPNDIPKFAQKIALWMNDKERRVEVEGWQKTYVKQFDVGQVGPQILEMYDRALQKRSIT